MDKIICVGKNYPDHAAELGDKQPDKPVLFIKPPSVLRSCNSSGGQIELSLPSHSSEVHHEIELVFRVRKGGYRLSFEEALKSIDAVTVGLDMTLRDLQTQAKKSGAPWTSAKVFPDAAVIGPWIQFSTMEDIFSQDFSLFIGDKLRQRGNAAQMIFKPAECLAYASEFFPICEGDLLFTGTPVGVGPVTLGASGSLSFSTISYQVNWTKQS